MTAASDLPRSSRFIDRTEPADSAYRFGPSAGWAGVVALVAGLIWLLSGLFGLLPIGAPGGPRGALLRSVQMEEGMLLLAAGSILALVGLYRTRAAARPTPPDPKLSTPRTGGLPSAVTAIAAFLLLVVILLSVLPLPYREVLMAPSDFQPVSPPINATASGEYLTSRSFSAQKGSTFTHGLTVTWTDENGALLDSTGGWEVYVIEESGPPGSGKIARTFVVPDDGTYTLLVWLGECATGPSAECPNATSSVRGWLHIESPTAFLPAQIGASVLSTALALASAIAARTQASRIGTR